MVTRVITSTADLPQWLPEMDEGAGVLLSKRCRICGELVLQGVLCRYAAIYAVVCLSQFTVVSGNDPSQETMLMSDNKSFLGIRKSTW